MSSLRFPMFLPLEFARAEWFCVHECVFSRSSVFVSDSALLPVFAPMILWSDVHILHMLYLWSPFWVLSTNFCSVLVVCVCRKTPLVFDTLVGWRLVFCVWSAYGSVSPTSAFQNKMRFAGFTPSLGNSCFLSTPKFSVLFVEAQS